MLKDLLVRAQADEMTAFAFLAEVVDRPEPLLGVVGRYRDQPTRLIGELSVMKVKMTNFANKKRPKSTFQDSVF